MKYLVVSTWSGEVIADCDSLQEAKDKGKHQRTPPRILKYEEIN